MSEPDRPSPPLPLSQTPGAAPGASSARQRTLATMNRLGAMAATVALLQSGCGDGTTGGYAVVDPMPPPAQCMGIADTITATAVWKAKEGGGFTVELTLAKPGRADASYVADTSVDYGGEIVSKTVAEGSATLSFEPIAKGSSASVRVGVKCSQGQGHVIVSMVLAGPPAAGQAVAVTLSDSY